MVQRESYLTLTEVLLSYALFVAVGCLAAGRTGGCIAAALVTILWFQAIVRAAFRPSHPEMRERPGTP